MHPLDTFMRCPVCGSACFDIHDFKSKRCADCGFVYYLNPSGATVAFIVNEQGALLVVRRAEEPARGTLDLPGGFVDIGETVEEGVAREVLEETGLTVTKAQYLFSLPNRYLFSGMPIPTLDLFFRCEVTSGAQPRPADDAAECFWLKLEDIRPELFGLHSVRLGVERFLKKSKL